MKLDPALKPYLHHVSTKTNSGYYRARLVGHPFPQNTFSSTV